MSHHNEFTQPSPMYDDIASQIQKPSATAKYDQTAMAGVKDRTSTSDAFTYLENELEDLHQCIEQLYDMTRNILRPSEPTSPEDLRPERPEVSDIQRALWNQGDVARRAKAKILDIISRIDV